MMHATLTPFFDQGESYETTSQAVKGKVIHTIVAIRDEARVTAMKKHIISAFTTTAILDYEHHIDINIRRLMKHLSSAGDEVDISEWNSAYSYDTICRVAFSEDQGVLDAHKEASLLFKAGRDRFEHWYTWLSLPGLERLIFKNKMVTWKTGTSPLGQMATARLMKRTEDGGLGSHHDLLDRYLQAGTKNPQLFTPPTIIGLALSTIHAGAETTAHSLTVTLFHLIRHPRVMASLRAELDGTKLSSPPLWTEVKNLPYLEAVIKESGRISPLLIGPVEREVPAGGMEIAGTYVPGGTIVAMNVHALNRDPNIWGADVDVFRPERWLEAEPAQLALMERSNLYFSAGRRLCIGQHIAWIEMKKYLPEFLGRFDVSPGFRRWWTVCSLTSPFSFLSILCVAYRLTLSVAD